LSPYFKSQEFQNVKGNNKLIMSVGIPHKLLSSLLSTTSSATSRSSRRTKDSVVRLKIYKIDRLHPDVVYLPKSYLFEMNRFPTRVLSNWNYDAFSKSTDNILTVPTKVYHDYSFSVDRDFSAAFLNKDYDVLSADNKLEIYSNHTKSFLAEEYLKWFTDCNFDETRYSNYAQLTKTLENITSQYLTYISIIGKTAGTVTSGSPAGVVGTFLDPTSGLLLDIPLSNSKSSSSQNSSDITSKKPVLSLDKTLQSFFASETLLLDTDTHERRAVYPKKFDRVFNVILDPDDFVVDESTLPSAAEAETNRATLVSLETLGIIRVNPDGTKNNNGTPTHTHRDTVKEDISLDEYFVTVEPYDYVQEYSP